MTHEFDDNGDLVGYSSLYRKIKDGGKLTGEDAAVFLAEEFASETHGNYCAETLHLRSKLHNDYKITVEKI